jgi:hypothetical protein
MTVTSLNPAYGANAPQIYTPDSYKVTVTALDENNVLQPGTAFVITTSGNNGTVTAVSGGTGTFVLDTPPGRGTCTTDATGTCTVIFTGTPSSGAAVGSGQQIDSFQATLDGVNIGANYTGETPPAPAGLTAGKCNPGGIGNNQCSPQTRITTGRPVSAVLEAINPSFQSPTQEVLANGVALATFQVVLKDVNGLSTFALGGETFGIARAAGETLGTFNGETCISQPGGCFSGAGTLGIASTQTGTVHISGTATSPAIGNIPVTGMVTVNFIAGTPDCTQSAVSASPSTLAADGSSQASVTITLKDATGNVPAATEVTFALPGSTYGSLSSSSCTSDATTGACSVTYTSPSTLPGGGTADVPFNVTAQISGVTCTPAKTAQITLSGSPNRNITIKKTVTSINPADKANGYVAGRPFTITVSCPSLAAPTVLQLADGETSAAVIAKLGETCTISEDPAIAGGGVINANYTNMAAYPSSIVISSDRAIDVVNTISSGNTPTASLDVHKTVHGDLTNEDKTSVFEITAACGDRKSVV